MSSLTSYVHDLIRGKEFEIEEEMQYEIVRLASFDTWPDWSAKRPVDLAENGFYYFGLRDRIKCYSCGAEFDDLLLRQDVTEEHRRRSPQCLVVIGLAQNNEKFESRGDLDTEMEMLLLNGDVSGKGYFDRLLESMDPDTPCGPHEALDCACHNPVATNGTKDAEEKLLKDEKYRLNTYDSRWLSQYALSPSQLAMAGFYYVGPEDTVQCAFCNGKLLQWKPTDDPLFEHKKHYPSCPFIGDIPGKKVMHQNVIQQSGTITYTIANPRFATEKLRLDSFKNWPKNAFIHPQKLAQAGFYYVGYSDNVKCFSCNGGLRSWVAEDDPWREHAHWFYRCGFLKHVKGEEYIQAVSNHYNLKAQMVKTNEPHCGGNTPSFHLLQTISNRKSENLKEEPVISLNQKESSMSRHQKNRAKKKTCQSAGQRTPKGDVTQSNDTKEPSLHYEGNTDDDVTISSTQSKDKDLLAAAIEHIKEERRCKICMDTQCNVVLLPCRHMMCCSECAPVLRTCPICRGQIEETLKVYIP